MALRAHARINLAAVKRNVEHLRAGLSPGTEFCAVVKANASGHGAIPVARAALAAGAGRLAVATAGEAAELRAAGIEAPVLVMGALSREEMAIALAARAEVVAWSPGFVDAIAAAAQEPVAIHVKYDSGMGRLGTRDLQAALAVADRVLAAGPRVALSRSDDPLRHRRRGARLLRRAARRLRALRRGDARAAGRASPSTPPTAPRRFASRPATGTWCAAGSRSTAPTR